MNAARYHAVTTDHPSGRCPTAARDERNAMAHDHRTMADGSAAP